MGDYKTGVIEEGVIKDESAGGPVCYEYKPKMVKVEYTEVHVRYLGRDKEGVEI